MAGPSESRRVMTKTAEIDEARKSLQKAKNDEFGDDVRQADQVVERRWSTTKRMYRFSPRGFCSYSPRCTLITEYYRRFFNPEEKTDSWDFKCEGIQLALDLIGPSPADWLKAQAESPYTHGRLREFLEDTIHYINTGRRKMSIQSWTGLVANETVEKCPPCVKKAGPLPSVHARDTADWVAQWCSIPGGFQDMVCTLNLLFGEPSYERALEKDLRQ